MLKETETIEFFVTFLSQVTFQSGGALAPLATLMTTYSVALFQSALYCPVLKLPDW